jgi:hypothetical protein
MVKSQQIVGFANNVGKDIICSRYISPPYLGFRREDARLTIIKIPRVRIQRPGNDSKFDLLKLFALDAGPFGESLFRFLEDLALKGVSTSESQKQNGMGVQVS